ncbi:hypothetical protein P167DRAFT_580661 [Morchella conica CCBAS932]|uniref:Uncharacterized protein n=1 Tax=Morchella conica CCBAS932 TaxID=1392247 RepID=A0A3N4KD68_9PEZI|nr:hypothetical protein P167DRAFT_580661 [Morchella conica CCBAS932]
MSVSSVASSVRSGSPTELDTDQDSFHGPSGYRVSPLSSPGGQILVNGVLESPQRWIDFDDHPVAEEDEVDVYEDDYDDYEEPGDENSPPGVSITSTNTSTAYTGTTTMGTTTTGTASTQTENSCWQYGSRTMVTSKRSKTPSRVMSRASLVSEPSSTSPSTSFRSSSTLRNEHHIERTPPPSQPYRATPPTQACATPAPESVYGSDRGDVPAEAKTIISAKSEVQIASSWVRSHLVFAIKDFVANGLLYGLKDLTTPEMRADKIKYLLENNCFISDSDNYVIRAPFHVLWGVIDHFKGSTSLYKGLTAIRQVVDTFGPQRSWK